MGEQTVRFRILILRDPCAQARGYSLKGIIVPLVNYCPVIPLGTVLDLDNKPVAAAEYHQHWKIPTYYLVKAAPHLKWLLRGVDNLLVPTEWCDVAPV